jgi:hypothetical protein
LIIESVNTNFSISGSNNLSTYTNLAGTSQYSISNGTEGKNVVWKINGDDANGFSINQNGVLS